MLWTFDVETVKWDQVRCVVFTSEEGDVETFKGPGAISEAAAFQATVKGTHVAHAGGIFDTLLISQARDDPWKEVVMSGSAVLCANDGTLRVRDSFRWWLAGLKKVGEFLSKEDERRAVILAAWKETRGALLSAWKEATEGQGVYQRRAELQRACAELGLDWRQVLTSERAPEAPHAAPGAWLKKEVDRQRIEDLTERECIDYCEHDCRILLEGVKEAHRYLEERGARKSWTAGSSALGLLQTLEPASWGLMKAHALPLQTAIDASACVRGARNETWALGEVHGVFSDDYKSMYPSCYASTEIGVGARRLEASELHDPPPGSVRRVRWFWPWRGGEAGLDASARIPPVLDQITGAGAGWCEAWCIEEEVAALEEYVGVQKIEGWAPECMAPIGQIFVRELFAEKERGSAWAKVFLNAFHGKCSEQPVRECWVSGAKPVDYYGPEPTLIGDQYWRYLDVGVDKRGFCGPNIQPLAAAQILGRARIRLWRGMRAIVEAGGEVYYCDTDSIKHNLPPERNPNKLGQKLGQLAPEGGPYTCLFCGPKAYVAIQTEASRANELARGKDPRKVAKVGEAVTGALKGVPWASLKDGVRERSSLWGNVYRQARGRETGQDFRVDVFREALQELSGAQVKKEGIATWAQGLRQKAGWSSYESIRTILPRERGKTFDRRAGPTTWAYRSPAELLASRGLDLSVEVHEPAEVVKLDEDRAMTVADFFDPD